MIRGQAEEGRKLPCSNYDRPEYYRCDGWMDRRNQGQLRR